MSCEVRGRPREFDTNAALDAAVDVFWQKGFEAASVSELCRAMGIGKQSMYDWVGDKRNLFVAAIGRYKMTQISGLEGLLKQDGSPLANLRQFLQMAAAYAKSEDCLGCLVTNAESEIGATDEKVKAATDDVEAYLVDLFTDVLVRAQNAKEIAASVDPAAVASALTVIRNGLMVAGRSGQSAESIDQTIALIETLLQPT